MITPEAQLETTLPSVPDAGFHIMWLQKLTQWLLCIQTGHHTRQIIRILGNIALPLQQHVYSHESLTVYDYMIVRTIITCDCMCKLLGFRPRSYSIMAPPPLHHLVALKGWHIQCLCEPHNGTLQHNSKLATMDQPLKQTQSTMEGHDWRTQ